MPGDPVELGNGNSAPSPADQAKAVSNQIDHNKAAAVLNHGAAVAEGGAGGSGGANQNANAKPWWHSVRMAELQTDASGNLIFENGQPKRKRGKPQQPKPGEKLGDGSTYQGQPAQRSRLVIPPRADQAKPGEQDVVDPQPQPDPMAPRLRRVVVDGTLNVVKRVGGDTVKPTKDEEECLRYYGGEGHWLAFFIVLVFYGVGVSLTWWIEQRKKAQEAKNGTHAQTGDRANAERQERVRETSGLRGFIGGP